MSETTETTTKRLDPAPHPRRRKFTFAALVIAVALATSGVTALLMNIFTRQQEARTPFVRVVDVNETTTDPAEWGKNWPLREYDSYKRTADVTRTRYGGSEAMPQQKLDRDPWLKRMYAGYAFSIDFCDRRGHAYMLFDQENTERVRKKPQPGACLHCHASATPTWRRLGLEADGKTLADDGPDDFDWPHVMKGFERMCAMSYTNAHAELLKTPDGSQHPQTNADGPSPVSSRTPPVAGSAAAPTTRQALADQGHVGAVHPVACIDCHDPKSMQLRVTSIQDRHHALIDRSSKSLVDMLDAIKGARQAGVGAEKLAPVLALQRKAQWRLDFISSENSMGFHALQEAARVLAESIDYSRQAVAAAQALHVNAPATELSVPAARPVQGVTPEKVDR